MVPSILVHGGAGFHAPSNVPAKRAAARAAADAGWHVLLRGGSALDAVEAAVRLLEDDPLFDAGYGSYLNRDGEVELDAILVDGETLRFGAVAAVHGVKNPITLARRVMDGCPHHLLVGDGAHRFARECGLTVPGLALIAPDVHARWLAGRAGTTPAEPDEHDRLRSPDGVPDGAPDEVPDGAPPAARTPALPGDTVGAVACDAFGHFAAATSTGGMSDKWPGRVGDSPIIGSGAWADDRGGAVSCTGHGELIMRVCLAHHTGLSMCQGATAEDAAPAAVRYLADRTGGQAGLIVLDATGRPGWARNTHAMPVAWRNTDGSGDDL
ncbi:MAG: isoaspartyl peptidase/L-asparaginase [Ardenticatenales bacterium]|nr:isoaspartyl peptidase/L-asparaginase [Ardenticatenales bacterium]